MKNTIIVLGGVLLLMVAGYLIINRDQEDQLQSATNFESRDTESLDDREFPTSSTGTLEAGEYTADTRVSTIKWSAGKPAISGYVHHGAFDLASGLVVVDFDSLSGTFVVDMDSLRISSLGGGKAGQESTLEGHLKGERFFNVDNYQTATFTISDITPKVLPGPSQTDYTATGELTMKGETKTISFPVKIVTSGEEVWLTADIEIDRTLWGITFGSAKIAERITDQIIGDTVSLELSIKLTK